MRIVLVATGILLALAAESVSAQTPGQQRRQERRQEAAEQYPELSLRIVNPLARVLTLSTSVTHTEGAGSTGDGRSFAIRMAPRIPFVLNEDWHLVSRIDVAWVSQENVAGFGRQEGLTDVGLTLLFSPDRSLGWDTYWGLGPAVVMPMATADFLGAEKLSVGPSFAFFRQKAPWTAGIQFTHLWSVAGTEGARDVNASVIRPLIAYTATTATTIALGAEFRHDWQRDVWVGPAELSLRQLTLIRGRPVHWTLGLQYFIFADATSPEWGVLFRVTLPIESPRWGRRIAGLESAN